MDNKNSFLELVSSPLLNLDHTYRYSGTKLVEAESLSQHIVDTIMMGLKIIDSINSLIGEEFLDPKVYVMKATYHDLEEAITGDVPRPLKYHDEVTLTSLRGVADEVAQELFSKEFSQSEPHFSIWNDAKEGKEGYILKLVDMLVVANKVVKEVSLLNNNYMLRVAHEVKQYLNEQMAYLDSHKDIFNNSKVDKYLSNLIADTYFTMSDILNSHSDLTQKINLYNQSMM